MEDNRIKVGFFGVADWERELIEKQAYGLAKCAVGIFSGSIEDNIETAADFDVISVFVSCQLGKKVLDKLPKLKMIATRSTGMDHIDLVECKKRKIEVANVPEYGSVTVAEYAFALMLALAKRIVVAHQSVEEGDFSPEGLTGVDLRGKTLGVVGVGRIGSNMVKLGRGFGMKVLGVARHRDSKQEKKLGYKFVDLKTCLKESDFVSLHVPSCKETFHLINRGNIELMKKGSYLINTCRGDVIEVEAILWGLNQKILAGVALDVAEDELGVVDPRTVERNTTKDDLKEVVTFHMLRDRDDVIFTPHNAFNSHEAVERIVVTTMDNIKSFLKKK